MRLLVNLETNQDTLAASCYSLEYCNNYMNGDYAPHYPLPSPYVESEIVGALWPWDYCTGIDTWPMPVVLCPLCYQPNGEHYLACTQTYPPDDYEDFYWGRYL